MQARLVFDADKESRTYFELRGSELLVIENFCFNYLFLICGSCGKLQ